LVLVDTSVWINHLRYSDELLVNLLNKNQVFTHDFIIGELACGNLNNREKFITYLNQIPKLSSLNHSEILYFLNENKLYGLGIGYIDVNLLASSVLNDLKIFTYDKHLQNASDLLNIRF
jgi:predicted nucleic acid-binding protein